MSAQRLTVDGARAQIRAQLLDLLAKRAELEQAITKLYAMLEGFECCSRALDAEASDPLAQDEPSQPH